MNVGGVGGEIPNEVSLLADELSRAVELTHLPSVSHEQRIQAYNVCERYVHLKKKHINLMDLTTMRVC